MQNDNQQRDFILRQAAELGLSIRLEDENELVRAVSEIAAASRALRGARGMLEEPAPAFRLEPWIEVR